MEGVAVSVPEKVINEKCGGNALTEGGPDKKWVRS
jgi:hypothetical protein